MTSEEGRAGFYGLGLLGVFIFLLFCNAYQPNSEIALLTLETIFMSLLCTLLVEMILLVILALIIAVIKEMA